MEATLREVLPRIILNKSFQIYPFQSKQDLLGKLRARLKGYAAWLPENYRIVVVVDRDDDDCLELKAQLEGEAAAVGLRTRSNRQGSVYQVVNRIVVEELEAWFFGDWEAVREAYPKMNRHVRSREGFRNPDQITGGTWEALQRLFQRAGYYRTGMPKVETAQNIARRLEPERNQSPSFQCFRQALREMMTDV